MKRGAKAPLPARFFQQGSEFAEAARSVALAPAFQGGRADSGGDGGHRQQGSAFLGVIAGEVAGVLGVAPRLFGVALHRLAGLAARTMQPVVGACPGVMTETPRTFAGVVAQFCGAMPQAVGAVTHAARDVVEAMTQGLGVEPATRIDAFAQALIAGRAAALIQQKGVKS